MIKYIIICLIAFLTSILTFVSGFGLGTILLPAFAIFFPAEVADAITAVVHFFNNIFKLTLVDKNAKWSVLLFFEIPAAIAAFPGASNLMSFAAISEAYK